MLDVLKIVGRRFSEFLAWGKSVSGKVGRGKDKKEKASITKLIRSLKASQVIYYHGIHCFTSAFH